MCGYRNECHSRKGLALARILRGKPVAQALDAQVGDRVRVLKAKGVVPTLAIVRVGEREDDLAYERGATRRCESLGIAIRSITLEEGCTQDELLHAISAINEDVTVHGCLLLRPLPPHMDEHAVCNKLSESKDVDCATDKSLLGVFVNRTEGFPPCTAEACIAILDHYGYTLEGANVCVLGRSLVIGKPVSLMLQARNATVTMCHTRTRDLSDSCSNADVVIVATGHPKTLTADYVHEGQVVVDLGINWDPVANKLCGDADYDSVEPVVEAITPVPGGVGSVTTAVLAKHVVEAAERMAR